MSRFNYKAKKGWSTTRTLHAVRVIVGYVEVENFVNRACCRSTNTFVIVLICLIQVVIYYMKSMVKEPRVRTG
ncbi:MAG: hypothetical protein IPO94_09365 [Saprospiraceae bacterium]|nr:hypothetical protein [Saprospiraceae bacterium]